MSIHIWDTLLLLEGDTDICLTLKIQLLNGVVQDAGQFHGRGRGTLRVVDKGQPRGIGDSRGRVKGRL